MGDSEIVVVEVPVPNFDPSFGVKVLASFRLLLVPLYWGHYCCYWQQVWWA
jgi:hypothetical protein